MNDKLKQELLDELDDFILDDSTLSNTHKKKALEELDRLIKQDLSYTEILSSIKKSSLPKIDQTDKIEHSSHILDLRHAPEPSKSVKKEPVKKEHKKWWQSSKKPKEQAVKKEAFHIPEKPHFSFDFGGQLVIFALIVTIVLLPIRGLVFVSQIQDDKDRLLSLGREGLVDLQSGVQAASANAYDQAGTDFDQALYNFNQAENVLNNYHSFILEAAYRVPVVGKPLSVSNNLLKVATNISEAAAVLNQEIKNQSNPTQYIHVINAQIKKTLPYLETADKDLQGISASSLPENYRAYFEDLKNYLPQTLENMRHLAEMFTALENLLGHDTEKRYLVLFQNNNELRATGGFIGSFGVFDIYQGKVVNLEVPRGGTYDLTASQTVKYRAPQALSLINPYFNIWDANWWPDFAKSAQKIIWQYENGTDSSSIDGVIAINAYVLQELLKVLGPIDMPEYGLTVTADNIFSVLQQQVEFNFNKDINQPKGIIADLVPRVLDKILKFENRQAEIVSVFASMLSAKDIQIYAKNLELEQALDSFGWAGKMYDNDSDYLFVVNTNIAGGKTDNDIYQTIDHQAEINQWGEIIDTVRITRTNRGNPENPLAGLEGGNMSYLRVYVPQGSQFLEAQGFDKIPESYFQTADIYAKTDQDIAEDESGLLTDDKSNTEIYNSLGKTVFANWLGLTAGETKTVVIKYKLPFKLDLGDPLTEEWWQKLYKRDLHLDNYSLLVQAQSGNHNTIFNSAVFLPQNFKVVWNTSLNPDQMSVNDNIASYTSELSRDQYFGFIAAGK